MEKKKPFTTFFCKKLPDDQIRLLDQLFHPWTHYLARIFFLPFYYHFPWYFPQFPLLNPLPFNLPPHSFCHLSSGQCEAKHLVFISQTLTSLKPLISEEDIPWLTMVKGKRIQQGTLEDCRKYWSTNHSHLMGFWQKNLVEGNLTPKILSTVVFAEPFI